jgi:GAF domain-containing protein
VIGCAFVALDLALPDPAAISGSYAFGAVVAGVIGGFRPALIVAVVMVVLAAASGIWNHDFASTGYFARLFVAFAGSLLALGAGRLRDEVAGQLARQQLLTEVADLPAPGETLEQTVARVTNLLVPRYAGFAAVEADAMGERALLGTRGTEPIDPSGSIETQLRARGIVIGKLTTANGRSGVDDPDFLRVFSGRVALALDNAGLSQELITAEQRLQAILENLGEAVTVQNREERIVFANRAAVELLKASSVEELMATPAEEMRARFYYVHADGSPLTPYDLPVRKIFAGEPVTPLLLRRTDASTGEERWQLTKSTSVPGPAGEVLLAVHVIEDVTEAKRAEVAQRLLSDASEALASSLDFRATLRHVAELTVPGLADWCAVRLLSGDELELIGVAGTETPDVPGDEERAARVLATGEVVNAERIGGGVRSTVVVPMTTPERVVGVLSLAALRRRFDATDVDLARELARRAATAIENARLYTQVEQVATTLQRSLLPPELPEVPGWAVHALYLPARGEAEVGGDFYDVFPTAAGWMAVMGDVVGRGAAAASLTAMGRYTLRTAGSLVGTPTMGLARLNENLREHGEMALCTAAVMLLRDDTSEASIVCAGHPLPLLVRGGEVRPVGRTGPLLGAFEQGHWLAASLEIQPGDVVVLYTDGVLDARGPDDRFGEERLAAALSGVTSAEQAVVRIDSALRQFAGGEQDDDTAVLALQKL